METTDIKIKFKGIDSWNRSVFVGQEPERYKSSYFGSVDTLFPDKTIAPNNTVEEIVSYFKENVKELQYFGQKFDCEPMGGLASHVKLIITD